MPPEIMTTMDRLKYTKAKTYDHSLSDPRQRTENERRERARAFMSRTNSLKYYINLIGLSARSMQITRRDDEQCHILS